MKWMVTLALLGLAVASARGSAVPKKKQHQASTAPSGKRTSVPATHVHTRGVAASRASGRAATSSKTGKSAALKTSRKGRGRYAKVVRAAPAPSYQTHPDPERYQEIQKALADRGYFKGEPNGMWDDDSVNALKAFQTDQKLEPDGKINARSLLGLGLGPKHEGSAVSSVSNLPPPPAVPAAGPAPPQ